jgi:HEAT repeat protein
MRQSATTSVGLSLALGLTLMLGTDLVNSKSYAAPEAKKSSANAAESISRHIALLKSGSPQEKAAAAYWLGRQRAAAATAVDPLVDLLGDASEINPNQYRGNKVLQKLTLGEEAAAALVNIGHPSIEPLIRVLRTSPLAEARKNAAWALGALHDSGATSNEI